MSEKKIFHFLFFIILLTSFFEWKLGVFMSSSYIPALSSNTIPAYIKSVIAIPSLDKEEEIKLFKEYKHSNNMEAAQKIILEKRN